MTIDYYNRHAETFVQGTLNVDMRALYEPFLQHLPENALILDAGCGSGRDSKAFIDMGYSVEAIDASEAMVEYASAYSGVDVQHQTFQQVDTINKYDAIWSCASLLHVPLVKLPEVITKLSRSLKSNGVWYLSFKYGNTERTKDGRTFTDLDEVNLEALLSHQRDIEIVETWVTEDARPDRAEKWLNAIVRKVG
ncbi:class I SAM-dependent methyltransferase [Vibrio parahaemolyticus]